MKFAALTLLAVLAIGTTAFVVPEKPLVAKIGHGLFCFRARKSLGPARTSSTSTWTIGSTKTFRSSARMLSRKPVKKDLKKHIKECVPPKEACKDLDFC
ncbi:unnamed protein product [Caenorhabditis auriculariae]|uniref:Uncharacterized protein n=1 Tax=Caenorhabditis auriculariae TaxID=2777116 RepID=A0A8S1HEC2_9PELO|nr:unnamed protein product [Caenorhabditis auriculariae]